MACVTKVVFLKGFGQKLSILADQECRVLGELKPILAAVSEIDCIETR